jgi:hypothetical protein
MGGRCTGTVGHNESAIARIAIPIALADLALLAEAPFSTIGELGAGFLSPAVTGERRRWQTLGKETS